MRYSVWAIAHSVWLLLIISHCVVFSQMKWKGRIRLFRILDQTSLVVLARVAPESGVHFGIHEMASNQPAIQSEWRSHSACGDMHSVYLSDRWIPLRVNLGCMAIAKTLIGGWVHIQVLISYTTSLFSNQVQFDQFKMKFERKKTCVSFFHHQRL